MSSQSVSVWKVVLVVAVVAVIGATALTGGLFVGYQWGHASGLAAALEQRAVGQDEMPERDPSRPFGLTEGGSLRELAAQPYLGVEFETITPKLAEAETLTADSGALIREVTPGSPADKAGLKPGDIVQEVNGQVVDADHTLRDRIVALEPADAVTLTVLRDDEALSLEATLGVLGIDGLLGTPFAEGSWPPGFRFRLECSPEPCTLQPWWPVPPAGESTPTD